MQILIEGILTIQCFVMLKLTCVYIKAKVIKNDITGMTVAINKACIE